MNTITHENLTIVSAYPVTWKQFFDTTLNYENLYINDGLYTDYHPTYLQFHVSSDVAQQSIQLHIPYANRLMATQLKYLKVCHYDVARQQWVIIQHTINKERKTIQVNHNRVGIFCVFLNHYFYSSFTQRLADEYPHWTEIRNNTESVGQQFLDFFGIELEMVLDYLTWIQEQKYLPTADMNTYDWLSLYTLPTLQATDAIQIHQMTLDGPIEIPILETLQEFFYNTQNQGGILDREESKFYSAFRYGVLRFTIKNLYGEQTYDIAPTDYHLWNAFDEFALLVGVERLHLETNEQLKERILDVFRYPSGTHDEGLTNGIARDLQLIQRRDNKGNRIIWQNDTIDLLLVNKKGKFIDLRSIHIDDKPLAPGEYIQDPLGNIRIYARNEGKQHTVSFIWLIEKHELHNRKDETLYTLMFKEDGQATNRMMKWVEYINTVAPVMWDQFNWDQAFWDTIDKNLTGLGYIPNIWDSNIEVWKNYKIKG